MFEFMHDATHGLALSGRRFGHGNLGFLVKHLTANIIPVGRFHSVDAPQQVVRASSKGRLSAILVGRKVIMTERRPDCSTSRTDALLVSARAEAGFWPFLGVRVVRSHRQSVGGRSDIEVD